MADARTKADDLPKGPMMAAAKMKSKTDVVRPKRRAMPPRQGRRNIRAMMLLRNMLLSQGAVHPARNRKELFTLIGEDAGQIGRLGLTTSMV